VAPNNVVGLECGVGSTNKERKEKGKGENGQMVYICVEQE
jgi:hypothetical protein